MTPPPDGDAGPPVAAWPSDLAPPPSRRGEATRPDAGRPWLVLGAVCGLLAVALSAYAAHAPFAAEPGRARLLGHALTMQGWHALALLAVGLLAARAGEGPGRRSLRASGSAFTLGVALFCGAVWWQAATGRPPGPVAPVGGTLLLAGWALLAAGAWRATASRPPAA